MNTTSISRRKFAQLLGAGAAAAVVRPRLSFAKPTQPTATSLTAGGNIVRLSANENPYGPSPKALQAITDSFGLACRYPDEHNNVLIDKLAKLNNVDRRPNPARRRFRRDSQSSARKHSPGLRTGILSRRIRPSKQYCNMPAPTALK